MPNAASPILNRNRPNTINFMLSIKLPEHTKNYPIVIKIIKMIEIYRYPNLSHNEPPKRGKMILGIM